jgi:hypothetical protein
MGRRIRKQIDTNQGAMESTTRLPMQAFRILALGLAVYLAQPAVAEPFIPPESLNFRMTRPVVGRKVTATQAAEAKKLADECPRAKFKGCETM